MPRKLETGCWTFESGHHIFSCLMILFARENRSKRPFLVHFCFPVIIWARLLGHLLVSRPYAWESMGKAFSASCYLQIAWSWIGRAASNVCDKLGQRFMLTSQLFPVQVILHDFLLNLWLIFCLPLLCPR